MISQVVRYELHDEHVALVTLDRPDKRNAVNAALASQLDACVKRAEADPEVRAVVLASSNSVAFCAGADLVEVAAGNKAALFTPDGGFAGFVSARRRKPWIAAATGAVLAGGLELCLACDMIVAGDGASFGLPEVKRSYIATEGGISRLVRAIPRAVALELLATGEPIDAHRAFALGLVNRVVPQEDVVTSALALARIIAENAPLAVQATVDVAKRSVTLDDAAGRTLARTALEGLRSTEDFREGPLAFLEKRSPTWKGR